MPEETMIITLAKVVAAVAWADGEVTANEVTSLKTLISRLPDITAQQWASLEIYLEHPVDKAERNRLVKELKKQLSSTNDKELAIAALRNLIAADGEITDEEKQIVADIETAIDFCGEGS